MSSVSDDTHQGAEPAPTGPLGAPLPAYPYWLPQERETTLLDIVRVLAAHWLLIALVTVLGTGAAVAYALLARPIYRAQAVIAPPEQKKNTGMAAALAAFGGVGAEIAGNLGFSLGASDANRLQAILESHRLIARTVTKYNLMPLILYDKWDANKKRWKETDPSKIPNIWDAEKALKRVFTIRNDAKTGMLTLSLELPNIENAKRILRYFLQELALSIQEGELEKIEINKKFVETELKKTSDPAIIAKLQTLLSEQVEKAMMARNVEHFAFELIDPPDGSDKKVKPRKALIGALGLVSSLFAGAFVALFADWVEKARASSS